MHISRYNGIEPLIYLQKQKSSVVKVLNELLSDGRGRILTEISISNQKIAYPQLQKERERTIYFHRIG